MSRIHPSNCLGLLTIEKKILLSEGAMALPAILEFFHATSKLKVDYKERDKNAVLKDFQTNITLNADVISQMEVLVGYVNN
jgi:hypothetical protein